MFCEWQYEILLDKMWIFRLFLFHINRIMLQNLQSVREAELL